MSTLQPFVYLLWLYSYSRKYPDNYPVKGNIKTDICHRSLKNNDTDQSIDASFQCDHFVKSEWNKA